MNSLAMDLAVYAESSSSNTKGRGKLRSVMGMNQDSNEVTFSGGGGWGGFWKKTIKERSFVLQFFCN